MLQCGKVPRRTYELPDRAVAVEPCHFEASIPVKVRRLVRA